MAVFDPTERKIVVRVVYDGPGFAGKTTNLERLYGFFTERRRSELFDAGRVDGRTRYFEWMHLDGGLVQGYSLRCQLVTVPGQEELSLRRWQVLAQADVVVFVCESSTEGVAEGRRMLQMLRSYLRGRGSGDVPIVLQANKQDLEAAVRTDDVRAALGLDPTTSLVGARAREGVGVRETAVLAIRAAANRVQRVLLERGIGALEVRHEVPEQLLASIRELEAAEAPAASPPPTPPVTAAGAGETEPGPPFPSPEVPPGNIWPSATGRDTLRRIALAGEPVARTDLVGQHGLSTGSGSHDLLIFEAGMWCLKTSPRRRFADPDEARAQLLRLARRKALLGELMPRHTVLTVVEDGANRHWLWTACPWLGTLRSGLEHASRRADAAGVGDILVDYARAVLESIALAARRGVLLDVHPSNFALGGTQLYYLDDDVVEGTRAPTLGHAVLQRVAEYASFAPAVERYLEHLERELPARFDRTQLDRIGLADSLLALPIRTVTVAAAQRRLLSALERCPR